MDMSKHRSVASTYKGQAFKFIDANQKIIAFLLTSVMIFFAQNCINAETFQGDASLYWRLSSSIWDFSFPEAIRGYFYPMLLSPSKYFFEWIPEIGYSALYLTQAIFFSAALTMLTPFVFTRLIGGNVTFTKRLIPSCLVVTFFPALVTYPLSDLPAFFLFISSIALLLLAPEKRNTSYSILLIFFAGALAYGSYNTRTIYIFPITLLLVYFPFLAFRNRAISARLIFMATFILGAAVAAIPQALINLKHLNSPTPLVVSTIKNSSLFAKQLKWGITIQRYETGFNTTSGEIFPKYYLDSEGEQLIKELGVGGQTANVSWYINTLLSEPASFLKTYAKHFINGLDVRDYDTYTKTNSTEHNFRSLCSIGISVLGLFCLIGLIARKKTPEGSITQSNNVASRALWTIILLSPVFAIIPGAIETRFFFPLHMLAYCSLVFSISRKFVDFSPKVKLLIACLYIAIVAIFFISASSSISNPTSKFPDEYR